MTTAREAALLVAMLLSVATGLQAADKLTFNNDVAPILERNCQGCHRPGEIGPMSLMTYEETRPWAKAIKEAVLTRKMPPWFADPEVGHFSNDRRLQDSELRTLVDWVDQGATEGKAAKGKAKDKRPATQQSDEWVIKPDVVYEMPKSFEVPATGYLDYVYILLPARFSVDTWVVDGEIRPGNRSAVHHASVIVRPPGSAWLKDAVVGQPHVPPKEGEIAVTNFNSRNDWLLGYVPGMAPQRYFSTERNSGRLIPAGSDLFLEMHYSPTGRRVQDLTKVGLVLAKQPPARQLLNLVVYDNDFAIPPNASNYPGHTFAILNEPTTLVYLQPHLHMRGTRMDVLATYPDGRTERLISVPRYNYQWQVIYVLAQPLKLPKGTRIDVSAVWDNSANNPFNPDPLIAVRVGQQAWDEMLVAILGVTVDRDIDPQKALTLRWNLP